MTPEEAVRDAVLLKHEQVMHEVPNVEDILHPTLVPVDNWEFQLTETESIGVEAPTEDVARERLVEILTISGWGV